MSEYRFECTRFQKSPKHKGIYDLIENESFFCYFIKCSEPKRDFIIVDLVANNDGIKKAHFYQFKNYIPINKEKFTLDFIENYSLNE